MWKANTLLLACCASIQTVVQAKVRNGKVINLKVPPEERMADVVIHSD
jgi:hypothetical protein